MLKRLCVVGFVLSTVMVLSIYAQKSTEIFIPIGKSPGASGKYSVIGKIDSVDGDTRVVTITGDAGKHSAKITEKTKIWLDKHELTKTNGPGSEADCKIGRRCEIKYAYDGETRTEEAEWIKIRVSSSN